MGEFGWPSGIVTVGGLYGGDIAGIAGILVGKQADLLDRSFAIPMVEQDALSEWADSQANRLRESNQLTWERSAILLALGAASNELLVTTNGSEDWTANRLAGELINRDEIWLLDDRACHYNSDGDEVMKADFEKNFDPDPKVFVIKSGVLPNEFITSTYWPSPFFKDHPTQPSAVFDKIVSNVWPDRDLARAEAQVIGHVSGVEIRRDVKIIYRTKRVSEST